MMEKRHTNDGMLGERKRDQGRTKKVRRDAWVLDRHEDVSGKQVQSSIRHG